MLADNGNKKMLFKSEGNSLLTAALVIRLPMKVELRAVKQLGLRLHTDRKIPSENPETDFIFRSEIKFSACAVRDTYEIGTENFRFIAVFRTFSDSLVILIRG